MPSTPSDSARAEPTSRISAAFCRRCFKYRADAPWRIVRINFRPRLARGSRETATCSRTSAATRGTRRALLAQDAPRQNRRDPPRARPRAYSALLQSRGLPDDVQLTIIIATTGRPTLPAAVQSATSQMIPGDELIIVFDNSGDAGDTPRNRVLDAAHGTHIAFLDDDDEYMPGAFE